MNTLTRAGVLVEDRLFATLDPTVRRIRLPAGLTVLLADTVGFIHKLPHQLVEAFKSTLEEVRNAALLLHVIDVAHPHWEEQATVVESVLAEIGAGDVPIERVLNKVDALAPGTRPPGSPDAVPISARTGEGIAALLGAVEDRLTHGLERVACALPSARGDVLAWLRRSGRIVEERYDDGLVRVTALVPPKIAGQLRKRIAGATGEGRS
jgi:GTP-binding protein HflX